VSLQVESRTFSVHPAIIKSLIHEQAGSLTKAITELIMNSSDAGATRIDIAGSPHGGLTLTDDGRGFQSREEILSLFEKFGLPHSEGDAVHGRFRVGRGQIMAYGRVSWRSGYFEMLVDLEGVESEFGYDLIEHESAQPGCIVTFTPNPKLVAPPQDDSDYDFIGLDKPLGGILTHHITIESVASAIKYIDLPVWIEGACVNTPASSCEWTTEDDSSYYYFSRDAWSLDIYSQGVIVGALDSTKFGLTGVMVSKRPLKLNMARNTIQHDCPVWAEMREVMRAHRQVYREKMSVIKDKDLPGFFHQMLHEQLREEEREVLWRAKSIEDVFGKKHSLEETFKADRFTFYDHSYPTIAEQVERQQLAKVVMPSTVRYAGFEPNAEQAEVLLDHLLEVFREEFRWHINPKRQTLFIPFGHYVELLQSAHEDVSEKELLIEEKMVLQVVRQLNNTMYQISEGPKTGLRKIKVGRSDTAEAWTDGVSTITLRRELLRGVRGKHFKSGISRLCSIIIHEYCHGDSSTAHHHHTLEFYQAFHDSIMKPAFGELVNSFFRRYLTGLAKHGIRPSGEHNNFIKRIAELEPQLAKKRLQ